MPRNAEVIRQWTILRDLEASRRLTTDDLAERTGVTTRTIRRDLEALQTSGFPLYDEVHDGKKYWTLQTKAFKRLDDTGFTLAELSALYFSRTLLECLAATPFKQDVASAFDKLATALTPGMRQFLDRLPLVFEAKGKSARGAQTAKSQHISKLLDATISNRRATMRYFSRKSDREQEYEIEPYRLVYSESDGLYLLAFVQQYKEVRTFYVDRIRTLSLHEEHFTPPEILDPAFAHSLGPYQGPPVHVVIEFDREVAGLIRERLWHASQSVTDRPDGGVTLALDVSHDPHLLSWIRGFGSNARVVSPAAVVKDMKEDSARMSARYGADSSSA